MYMLEARVHDLDYKTFYVPVRVMFRLDAQTSIRRCRYCIKILTQYDVLQADIFHVHTLMSIKYLSKDLS